MEVSVSIEQQVNLEPKQEEQKPTPEQMKEDLRQGIDPSPNFFKKKLKIIYILQAKSDMIRENNVKKVLHGTLQNRKNVFYSPDKEFEGVCTFPFLIRHFPEEVLFFHGETCHGMKDFERRKIMQHQHMMLLKSIIIRRREENGQTGQNVGRTEKVDGSHLQKEQAIARL